MTILSLQLHCTAQHISNKAHSTAMAITRSQRSCRREPSGPFHSSLPSLISECPFILPLLCEYLTLQDILLSLSPLSRDISSLLTSPHSNHIPIIWRQLLLRYFSKYSLTQRHTLTSPTRPRPLPNPNNPYQEFRTLASVRIWNWDSLFHSRIFWAQVFFTLNQYFEDHRIFGASFSSKINNLELKKLQKSLSSDWNDGHNLLFSLPNGYSLCYQISDHTMGTWTLRQPSNSTEQEEEEEEEEEDQEIVCRLDGHPILPGFTYEQAEILITYLTHHHPSTLLFDSSFLWPLFFPFIELSSQTAPYCDQLITNLKTSGWRSLRLSRENWRKLEEYIHQRCDREATSSFSATARPILSSLCQLIQTQSYQSDEN